VISIIPLEEYKEMVGEYCEDCVRVHPKGEEIIQLINALGFPDAWKFLIPVLIAMIDEDYIHG
jgi:hypothetical protein